MKQTACLALCFVLSAASGNGQSPNKSQEQASGKQQLLWNRLGQEISHAEGNLDGVMGVAIEDLTTGQKFLLHSEEVFPQASSIKIASQQPS